MGARQYGRLVANHGTVEGCIPRWIDGFFLLFNLPPVRPRLTKYLGRYSPAAYDAAFRFPRIFDEKRFRADWLVNGRVCKGETRYG